MAVSQFKDISWGDEPLDTNKLNTMVANTRYLFERAPKLYYHAYGVHRDTGLRIACGTVTVPRSDNKSERVNVYFGSFFKPGSRPIVVTQIVSPYNRRVVSTVYGLSGASSLPDHRGFVAVVAAVEFNDKVQKLAKTMHLNWIAMGY